MIASLLAFVIGSTISSGAPKTKIDSSFVSGAEYGMVGDGVTDNTSALQAAITKAAVYPGNLYIPPGTYVITSTITPPSGVHVFGAGTGQTTIVMKGTGAGRYAFSFPVARSSVVIEGLTITTTNDVNAASAAVFVSSASSDIIVRNNEISYFYDYGVRANTASSRVVIQGNVIHDITRGASCTGINASFLTDSLISDNRIYNIGTAPGNWAIYSSNNLVNSAIRGNVIDNAYGGIKMTATSVTHHGVVIANNVVSSTIGAQAIVFGYVNGVSISGNSLYNNPSGIICDGQVTGFSISANNIDFNGAGSSGSVALSLGNDTCTNGTVSGNTLIGTTLRDGIDVTNADHIAISGNTFRDFQRAIYLAGANAHDISISGNMFWSSSNKTAIATATASNVQVIGNYFWATSTSGFLVDLGVITGAVVSGNVTNTDTVGRTTGASSNVLIENNIIGTTTQTTSVAGTNIVVRNNHPFSTTIGPRDDASTGLTGHAGGGQGSATALPSRLNVGSCATDHDSFILPPGYVGAFAEMKITGTKICDVYPASGEDAGAGTNTAVSITSGSSKVFRGQATGTWFSR
jgi:hypothetical protein